MAKRQTDPVERFTSRFNRSTPDECWEWTGSRVPHGYGLFWPYGRAGGKQYAHRFSYEHFVGPIPDGHQVDHLCKNAWCVNPAHLEPVTALTNMRRANHWTQDQDGAWFCSQGHPMPDGDLSGKSCALCFNEYKRQWREDASRSLPVSDSYNAVRSRSLHMRALIEEHPALEAEAREIGIPVCRSRLRHHWTYDKEGWTKPNGLRVPFGYGPVRS